MKKVNIKLGQIYSENHNTTQAQYRAARFSRTIHLQDKKIIEGNTANALEWGKHFYVR